MKEKFIINDLVVFHPEQHRLIPLGNRGKETALNVPASRCLLLMLQRPASKINKTVFFREVWENNGQYVTANTFHQNISLLRKGMRNAGIRTSVIQTIPKYGVRFTGTVQVIEEENQEVVTTQTSSNQLSTPKVIDCKPPPKATPSSIFLNKLKKIKFLMFFVTCVLLLFTIRSQNSQFIETHIKIADINQCSVYVSSHDLTENYGQYINYLTSQDVVCSPGEFIYVVNQLLSDDALFQFCESDRSGDLNCSVRFKLSTVRARLDH
ncbi:TPA: transcriptional regulator [Serratia fonticola]